MKMQATEYDKMYQIEEDNWWYVGRRELLLEIVNQIKAKSEFKTLKILDVGCGTGLNLNYLERYGNVVGLDFSGEALEFAKLRGRIPLVRASADNLPIKNESINMLCAFDTLEHIDDDKAALREFYRVLNGDGYLILTVPAFRSLWSAHDIAVHHKRRYSKDELIESLLSSGFKIQRISYWNFLLFPLIYLVRLFRRNRVAKPSTDLRSTPFFINYILILILKFEALLLKGCQPPFGVSIVSVCKKADAKINPKRHTNGGGSYIR